MNEDILILCLSNRSRMRGMPSYTPYSKKAFVGRSGSPRWIGSGITPPAPEIGCPPASNIKETLTAKRAPFGQNDNASDIGISFVWLRLAVWEMAAPGRVNAAAPARINRRDG